MTKFSCAALLLLINFGNSFVKGQSTAGGCRNEEQERINGLSELVNYIRGYYKDMEFALTQSIQSEFLNLKAQIARLENRIERHDTFMNSTLQEMRRQIELESMKMKNEIQAQWQKLPSSHCPRGFNYSAINFPKCYAVLTETANWNTAQQKCKQLHKDAHLAVINSGLEQQIINQMLQNYNCRGTFVNEKGERMNSEYFWVGGQLQNTSDCRSTFVWKPDSRTSLPIIYTNWFPGEPNCAQNIENSLSLRTSGQWNDLANTWSFCSVCEVIANV